MEKYGTLKPREHIIAGIPSSSECDDTSTDGSTAHLRVRTHLQSIGLRKTQV